jgi:hypothetical protein
MSFFPLTNSYFSRWLWHHQPDEHSWIITNLSGWIGAILLGERSHPVMLGLETSTEAKIAKSSTFGIGWRCFFRFNQDFLSCSPCQSDCHPAEIRHFHGFCRCSTPRSIRRPFFTATLIQLEVVPAL